MTTQTIKVEGLPEGWKAKEFRLGEINEPYFDPATKSICRLLLGSTVGVLIVEKIQPRRIVLEEISKEEYHRLFHDERCTEIYNLQRSYWKQVKETDIPLTNDDANVKIGVSQGDGDNTKVHENTVKVSMPTFSYEFSFNDFNSAYATFNSLLVRMNEIHKG